MAALSDEEIRSRLEALASWEPAEGAIAATYRFPGFGAAVAFVVRVAFEAEAADHHPDVDLRYDRVHLVLSTHSEGGVTGKDLALAATIEALADG